MINPDNLTFGDIVYVVNEKNNCFSKQKIKMIDDNGVEWFRYDRDHWEYSISQIVYCGRVDFTEQGEVRFEEARQTEFHFKYPDGQIYLEYLEDLYEVEEWFHTLQAAEDYVEELKLERSVL